MICFSIFMKLPFDAAGCAYFVQDSLNVALLECSFPNTMTATGLLAKYLGWHHQFLGFVNHRQSVSHSSSLLTLCKLIAAFRAAWVHCQWFPGNVSRPLRSLIADGGRRIEATQGLTENGQFCRIISSEGRALHCGIIVISSVIALDLASAACRRRTQSRISCL